MAKLGSHAISIEGPYQQVFLAGVTVQQGIEGRQKRHVERGTLGPRQSLELLGQFCMTSKGVRSALVRLHRRPWPIGWQGQRWQLSSQLLLPVCPQMLTFRSHQHLCLPSSIVRILQIERWKKSLDTGLRRRI